MTPEEKAKELIDKFDKTVPWYAHHSPEQKTVEKQCALICVDEIMDNINPCATMSQKEYDEESNYWQQVKQEIQKI